jgi:hypothetical protein
MGLGDIENVTYMATVRAENPERKKKQKSGEVK